jgi:excisionase family DNA binding protein
MEISTEKPLFLRPVEVARMLSISRARAYELIAIGALPSVRLAGGRLIRVPRVAVEQIAERALASAKNDAQ